MKKIAFIDSSKIVYNGHSLHTGPLGGTESVVINLSEALCKAGYDVSVYNQCEKRESIHGVSWCPFDTDIKDADYVIVNNNPKLFYKAQGVIADGAKPVLWLHNVFYAYKFIRRKQYGALLKFRPHGVFLGEKQKKSAGFFLPFRSRSIIPHGVFDQFLGLPETILTAPRPKRVIFVSSAYRGLEAALKIWRHYIHTYVSDAEFYVYGAKDYLQDKGYDLEALKAKNIILKSRVSKDRLIDALCAARVMFYLGHKDETFCNAAAEAAACGVPIVTKGIGSLSERVLHGQTGFIKTTDKALGQAVVKLLSDDTLHKQFAANSYHNIQALSWRHQVLRWEEDVFS